MAPSDTLPDHCREKIIAMAERLTETFVKALKPPATRGTFLLGHGAYRLRHQGICADQGEP